jgi:ABC-type bacteriocin/lantibiotic exporter with double-glycine peptidase domain
MVRLAIAAVAALALGSTSSGIWLDVPYVKQERNGCGSAVIAMVAQYWAHNGAQVPPEATDARCIQKKLHTQRQAGIRASDMERYFQANGFRTFVFRGSWEDFTPRLSKGQPLIVCLKENGAGNPLHYVVVVGFDWDRNLILVNDPAQRKLLKMPRSVFEKQWGGAQNWTLLAIPQQTQ